MWAQTASARRALLFLLAICSLGAAAAAPQDLPHHIGKVNDFAALLDPSQRDALEAQLADLERATSAEVAVVTVVSLGGRSVEEYATELFNAWGIGKRDRDNGVLVLVAVQDRAVRIEVGYGLEGILPDGLAGSLIRERFLPRFRDGDYRTGILDGTTRIIEIVRKNETLTTEQRDALDLEAVEAGKLWGAAALAGIFVGIGAFTFGTAVGARIVVQLLFGLCFTGGALFLSTFVSPRPAIWLLHLWAFGVAAFGYRLALRPKWRRKFRGPGSGGPQRWIADGGGGSSSSSSSDSGSSGDYGGGSSGGGGASGHW